MRGIQIVALLALLAVVAALSPSFANAQEAALNIVIVEGDGAVNNIRQRTAREPIVRVEDENRKPIAGATVVFLLPSDGASGTFPGGERMITVQTNQQGEAAARGLRPNNVTGEFSIRVTASFGGRSATAVILQTNTLAGAAAAGAAGGAAAAGLSTTAKILTIVGIAAAATVGGVYAATRDGGGGTPPVGPPQRPPTAITIGSPSVGAP